MQHRNRRIRRATALSSSLCIFSKRTRRVRRIDYAHDACLLLPRRLNDVKLLTGRDYGPLRPCRSRSCIFLHVSIVVTIDHGISTLGRFACQAQTRCHCESFTVLLEDPMRAGDNTLFVPHGSISKPQMQDLPGTLSLWPVRQCHEQVNLLLSPAHRFLHSSMKKRLRPS